jgi:hypothetical protein
MLRTCTVLFVILGMMVVLTVFVLRGEHVLGNCKCDAQTNTRASQLLCLKYYRPIQQNNCM